MNVILLLSRFLPSSLVVPPSGGRGLMSKPLPPEGGTTNFLKADHAFARQRFDRLVGVIHALQYLPRVLAQARRGRPDRARRGRKLQCGLDMFQSALGRLLD